MPKSLGKSEVWDLPSCRGGHCLQKLGILPEALSTCTVFVCDWNHLPLCLRGWKSCNMVLPQLGPVLQECLAGISTGS